MYEKYSKFKNKEILNIIKHWNNIKLDDILNIYKDEDIFSDEMKIFLKGLNKRNTINKSMKLFIYNYNKNNYNIEDTINSLIYRYPVYMGKNTIKDYYPNRLKETLNYSIRDIRKININKNIRYGILGKTYKNPTKNIDKKHRIFWSYHIWGINLESTNTYDYFEFINKSTNKILNDKIKEYYLIYNNLFNSILSVALYIHNKTNKIVSIKMPLIGMGYYLKTINDKYEIKKNILDMIHNIFNNTNIILYLSMKDEESKEYFNKLEKNNIKIDDNLFIDNIDKNNELLVVNAWDSRSFIGNGLSYDNSIDGWFVSGNKYGDSLQNSSYFHNPFLSPSLLDNKNWVYL